MGITAIFRRPAPRQEGSDSEFAATVATLPPGAEASVPLPTAGQDAGALDSLPPDSLTFDSQPFDSQPFDSQPPDSVPPDSQSFAPSEPPKPPPGPFDPHPAQELPAYLGGQPPRAPAAAAAAEEAQNALPMADQPTIAQVGRYALKRSLGLGGLGQVHEAWDPLLSRTVAIKTLQFESDPRTRNSLDRLFLNEARAVAGLSHPNIVTVYDAGLSPQGVYLAMERLQGKDLRQKLGEGWKPGPAVVAQLVRRIADALAYAHARGVVHCDIKPGNIFISGNDKPKVLDFGIARVAHGRAVPAALQGTVAGSPHYLAPEQLLGKDVDARTDIYSLGVVFYELLSGRRAFGGDSVEQITTAVLTNHPAPAHLIRSGVPEALSAIAARAMARDPEARYATASEMAADIRNWFEQPRTTGNSRSERAEARRAAKQAVAKAAPPAPRRWPWAIAGASAALVGILAVGVVLVLRPGQRPAPPLPAVAATSNATSTQAAANTPPAANPRDGDVVMSGGVPVAEGTTTTNAGAAPASASATPGGATTDSPQLPNPVAAGRDATASGAPATSSASGAPGTVGASDASATAVAAKPAPATTRNNTAATRVAANARDAGRRTGQSPAASSAVTAAAATATGTLQLAISPWGQVEVDGQPAGTTPPLTQLTLPAGPHSIIIRNADFPPFSTMVQVQADKPTVVRHRFGQ
ncbi:MAG: protein kinase [Rubrivivax sp.]|nr:protein kinase [Rubrivivax sp.]